jgi:flavin-dependent dehydrogenase
MTRFDYDVLVIGAGPAGSSLAQRLGRAGYHVALLDRKRFPREKPCGEFMSPECLPLLEDLGVHDTLLAHGARQVSGMRLYGYSRHATGHYRDIGRCPAPFDHGFAVQRSVMDEQLLRSAEQTSGVEVFEGWSFRGVLRDADSRITGVRATSEGGQEQTLTARWTVGADGVRSNVARELGVQKRISWLDKVALTTHYEGVELLPTAELHVFAGGYFAAAPVDGGLFSLNLIVDRAMLRERDKSEGHDALIARYLDRAPRLRERMESAQRVRRVRGIGPLAFKTRRQCFDGAVLVGDACGYVDPMTGEGMFFALKGAEILASQLAAALANDRRDADSLREYARMRKREVTPRLLLSKALQVGLRYETLGRTLLKLLERRQGIMDLLVSMTGDYVRPRELLRPGVWRNACRARVIA